MARYIWFPMMAIALVGLAQCATMSAENRAQSTVGKPAKDFELTALDGGKVKLSDYRGKPVVLAFWAVDCPPCRAEAPHLSTLVDKYGKDGLAVLAVNAWDDEKAKVEAFVSKNKLKQRILLKGGAICDDYGFPDRSVPTVFWIDRTGRIVDSDVDSDNPIRTLDEKTRALLART